MINVAELTCEQVNEELAKRRMEGWFSPTRRVLDGAGQVIDRVRLDVPEYRWHDYCHDWRWAGVLLEEMVDNLAWGETMLRCIEHKWQGVGELNHKECIARAWLQWDMEREP